MKMNVSLERLMYWEIAEERGHYIDEKRGCVFTIVKDLDSDGDYLIYTPMFAEGPELYDLNEDNWIEVEYAEDADEELFQEWLFDHLRAQEDGLFADPARMVR